MKGNEASDKRFEFLGIVGATGLIGQGVLELIAKAGGAPPRCFASPQSVGRPCPSGSQLEALRPGCFEGLRQVVFCTPAEISQKWVPEALQAGCRVVDGSSQFRLEPEVALIIPEVNGEAQAQDPQLIASPNCVVTIALLALAPLHRLWGLEELSVSTYQAASGGGLALQEALKNEIGKEPQKEHLALNLWPLIGPIGPDGYSDEETKIRLETQKILKIPQLAVSATCVRVPTLRTHAMTLEARFSKACSLKEAQEALMGAPGLVFHAHDVPTLLHYAQNPLCAATRLRLHPDFPNRLSLYVLGDQLLKGGSLNLFQLIR